MDNFTPIQIAGWNWCNYWTEVWKSWLELACEIAGDAGCRGGGFCGSYESYGSVSQDKVFKVIRHEQELRCDKASLSSPLGLDCTRFTQTGCVISKSLLEKWANDSSLEYLVKDHAVLLGTVDPAHLQQDVTWLHSIHDAVSLACCAGLEVDLRILGIILLSCVLPELRIFNCRWPTWPPHAWPRKVAIISWGRYVPWPVVQNLLVAGVQVKPQLEEREAWGVHYHWRF